MTISTQTDITPNSTATPLAANPGALVTWLQVTANGSTIRLGDSNVSATRGMKCPSGVPVMLPRCDANQTQYDLSQVYVYGTGADYASVLWGV